MNLIDFNTYDHNFCESTIYSTDQHPEYANAISSLFISWIGYMGLTNPHNNFSTIMLYSSLFINGITSCAYHYWNTIGWGLLDRMSMVLIAMSSTYLFVRHIEVFLLLDNWTHYEKITKLIHVVVISYFTLLFTIGGLHWETTFNVLFGLFLVSLAIYMWLVDKHKVHLKLPHLVVSFGWTGVGHILKSGIFWILTEIGCNHIGFLKYLFGHVWWHVFVSYGGYLISLIPMYLHMNRFNNGRISLKYRGFLPYLDYNNHWQ